MPSGQLIDNRFRVIRPLGEGGSAEVFLVTDDQRNGRRLALKLLRADAAIDQLRGEFELLSTLRHPNLTAIFDIEISTPRPYVTCEYVDGPDIARWARQRPVAQVVRALAGLLRALCLLHDRGYVHGDLKPANVLVPRQGPLTPKLIDFGLAVELGQTTGVTVGYAAPELLAGGTASPQSDIYAFGALALESLSGKRPFGDDPGAAIAQQLSARGAITAQPQLPHALVALLRRCLAPQAQDRFSSVVEVLEALQGAGFELSPDPRALPTLPQARLVGREQQARSVADLLSQSMATETARALGFLGERGMGKSRMLQQGRYLALRQGFACYEGTTVRQILSTLATSLADDRAVFRGLGPALAGLFCGSETPPAVDAAPGSRLRLGLLELVAAATRRRPSLLLIDDVDRLEPDEQEAVFGLIQAITDDDPEIARTPLVCIVSACTVVDPLRDLRWIELPPLEREEAISLVRSLLPGMRVEQQVLEALVPPAGGNPWLIEEHVAIWRESDRQPHGQALAYPERVLAVARDRLAHLAPAQRQALRVAALAPALDARVFAELAPDLTDEQLQQMIGRRLLHEQRQDTGLGLALTGEHLRQVLLAELPVATQRALHATIAGVIGRLSAPPAQQGFHLEQAGQLTEAASSYLRAAEQEVDYRGQWALHAAQLAGEQWPRWAEAKRSAAASLGAVGELRPAANQLEQLLAAGRGTNDDRLTLAELLVTLGQPRAALELLQRVDPASSSPTLVQARALLLCGEHDRALEICQQLPPSGGVHNVLGLIWHARGQQERAAAALQEADELYRQAGDEAGLAKVANNLAMVHQVRGQLNAARDCYQRAIDHAKNTGDHFRVVLFCMNHGTICQLVGAFGRALEDYEQSVLGARRFGSPMLEQQARLNLTTIRLELGDHDGAARELAHCASSEDNAPGPYLELNRAELALARSDYRQVEQILGRVSRALADTPNPAVEAERLLLHARLALVRGEQVTAEARGRQAAERAEAASLSRLVDRARLIEAIASRHRPDCDLQQVRSRLERVVQQMEERSELSQLWRAYHELSITEALLGLELEASFHRAKAGRVVDQILEQTPSDLRQTLLRRTEFHEVFAATRQPSHAGAPTAQPAVDAEQLLRLNVELGRIHDPRQLVELILDKSIELTGAQRGFVILLEAEQLRVAAARNVDQQSLKKGAAKISEGVAREVLASGKAVVTVDALDDQRFARFDSVHLLKLRSVVCVPLKIWGATAGVVYLDNRFRPGAFSDRHVALLEGFGAQAGLALHTARLLQTQREQIAELRQAKQRVEALTAELRQTIGRQSIELQQAEQMVQAQRRQLSPLPQFDGIIAGSPAMQRVLELVHKIADTEISLYLFGESGTGKEVIARAVHACSPRGDGPIVAVNCGALSTALLASEMFGHVKGAFTGAVSDRTGLIETAKGGTLFLDEVTEMGPELQVQLLRVLETGDFRPVGSERVRQADVRIISASNVDLEREVQAGRFREDLSYRLNVMRIDLPPLRDRREDIIPLARHFAGALGLHRQTLPLLLEYGWPGNVRELANELTRAAALVTEGEIRPQDLSPKLRPTRPALLPPTEGSLAEQMAAYERHLLVEALEHAPRATDAARWLGLSRAAFYRKLSQHGIEPPRRRRKGKTM